MKWTADAEMPYLSTPDFGFEPISLDPAAFSAIGTERIFNRYVKPRAYPHISAYTVKYDHAKDFAMQCGPKILGGQRIDALVSGNFIFGDFLEAFSVEANIHIDDLTLSTLAVSQDNVDSLRNMMQGGYLNRLNIIVSDYFWSHNRHNAGYIYKALDTGDRFQLAVAGTHTKIALLSYEGKKLVIHGSANMRSSRSVETFTVETNPDLYDFHMEWKLRILERYATIKKSVRASQLYTGITTGEWK